MGGGWRNAQPFHFFTSLDCDFVWLLAGGYSLFIRIFGCCNWKNLELWNTWLLPQRARSSPYLDVGIEKIREYML